MIVVYPTTELLRIGLFGLSYNYLRTRSDFVLEQSFVHCQRVDTILIQSSVNFHKRKINEDNEDSVMQWCTTSGPRATSGPRRVVMWPAMSNRKRRLFKTGTDIKSAVGYTSLLQLGFYLINHVSSLKMKPKLFQQSVCSGNLI